MLGSEKIELGSLSTSDGGRDRKARVRKTENNWGILKKVLIVVRVATCGVSEGGSVEKN